MKRVKKWGGIIGGKLGEKLGKNWAEKLGKNWAEKYGDRLGKNWVTIRTKNGQNWRIFYEFRNFMKF